MQKKVLLEKIIYHKNVSMPEGFEINPIEIASKIIETYITGQKLNFCKATDIVDTYVRENLAAYEDVHLESQNYSGRICYSNQVTELEIDKNSDFTMLYGVHINDCIIHIMYENDGEKLMWDIPLKNNKFILFSSKMPFYITNKQENHHLNMILKITYTDK
jgi:hypothetical protein